MLLATDKRASRINFTEILVSIQAPHQQYVCSVTMIVNTEIWFSLFVNTMSNVIFLHRGFFPKTVGSLCWLGAVGEFSFSICPRASVTSLTVYLSLTTECVYLFQVLFCADLKKFQKLKEVPHLKQPQEEEHGEGETSVVCKKTKMQREKDATVNNMKTKLASHKKAKLSAQNERMV